MHQETIDKIRELIQAEVQVGILANSKAAGAADARDEATKQADQAFQELSDMSSRGE